jgi:glycerophosphoryl diester phosphodiesterase
MAMLRALLERAREPQGPRVFLQPPLIIAHRGAAGEAPENTMAAFALALRQGADGIELDVHLSADGVPVVIHDARLEGTTSGSGWVAGHSVSALKRLDAGSWFSLRFPAKARPRYAGRKIPLLAEVLDWAGGKKCRVFAEIKRGGEIYPGIEAKVIEEVRRTGTTPLVTVVSFDLPTLRRLRELDSGISLGASFNRPLRAVHRARSVSAEYILPHRAFASRRLIRRAHAAGLRVIPWTVNQPVVMLRKISDGVDGLITDYPARLSEILARLQNQKR